MTERRYSREEVDAILGRAIERDRPFEGISHAELLAVASEVGVTPESLERAAAEVGAERQQHQELVQLRADAWRGFVGHLIPYVFVNALLILLNYATTRFPWALFPLLGWGIGLFSHLMAVVFPSRERVERRLARERDRERRKQLKRDVKVKAKQLEAAVGEGVAALLQVAAEKVREGSSHVSRATGPGFRVDPRSQVRVDAQTRAGEAPAEEDSQQSNPERRRR